ncbi:MAG: ABC transporter permease [Chloroflexi bacterium]|nr:ABC transporter permease [Chloroflexota bacterium]
MSVMSDSATVSAERPGVHRTIQVTPMMHLRRFLLGSALPWLAFGVGLLLWEAIGQAGWYTFLPPFSGVLTAFWELIASGRIWAIRLTLESLSIGFGLSLVLGIVTGIAMARSPLLEYVLDPWIDAFMTIPSSALIPLYLILFGLGAETRVVIVFMHAYFVVVINTLAGARAVDAHLVEMARAFGAREGDIIRRIVLPSALPLVLTGMRLGFGRAVRGIINGETILASVGIGQLLIRYGRSFQMEALYAVVLTIVILAVVGTTLVGYLEKRLTRWQKA